MLLRWCFKVNLAFFLTRSRKLIPVYWGLYGKSNLFLRSGVNFLEDVWQMNPFPEQKGVIKLNSNIADRCHNQISNLFD